MVVTTSPLAPLLFWLLVRVPGGWLEFVISDIGAVWLLGHSGSVSGWVSATTVRSSSLTRRSSVSATCAVAALAPLLGWLSAAPEGPDPGSPAPVRVGAWPLLAGPGPGPGAGWIVTRCAVFPTTTTRRWMPPPHSRAAAATTACSSCACANFGKVVRATSAEPAPVASAPAAAVSIAAWTISSVLFSTMASVPTSPGMSSPASKLISLLLRPSWSALVWLHFRNHFAH